MLTWPANIRTWIAKIDNNGAMRKKETDILLDIRRPFNTPPIVGREDLTSLQTTGL